MGSIASVSLPSIMTCRECGCNTKCYARKLENLRKTVRRAYRNNLDILIKDPNTYWREVEAAIMLSRFFRFHVSGDIPNSDYFEHMVQIAERQLYCQILCFTKKFEIINRYVEKKRLPENLHVILSAWKDFDLKNPFNLPEAHVRYRDGSTTASESAKKCSGNCTECAVTDSGCWVLKNGEQIVFDEH